MKLRILIAKIFDLYIGVALIIFFVLMLFIDDILRIMTTPPFYSAAHLIVYLVPAAFLGQNVHFCSRLFISKKTNTIGMINFKRRYIKPCTKFSTNPSFRYYGCSYLNSG